jgi:cell division protein FtsL
MTEFFTVKQIDNSRLVRELAPGRVRECCRWGAWSLVLAIFCMLYAWQHFQCIQLRCDLQDLQERRAQSEEVSQELRIELATLRSPMRIDAIARGQLGLTVPLPGQVAPASAPSEAVLAQMHPVSAIAARP